MILVTNSDVSPSVFNETEKNFKFLFPVLNFADVTTINQIETLTATTAEKGKFKETKKEKEIKRGEYIH